MTRIVHSASRRVGVAAVLVFAAGMLAATNQPATAAASNGPLSAYWWIVEQGAGGLPGPPQVPAGGLYVASDANGATAVSALRLTSPSDARLRSLTLHVHNLQTLDSFAVNAYAADGSWKPGDAQPWDSRPAPIVGSLAIHGVVNAARTAVTFDLTELTTPTVNLVVVPGVNDSSQLTANATSTPSFDASFESVKSADIAYVPTAHPSGDSTDKRPAPAAPPVSTEHQTASVTAGAALRPVLPAGGAVSTPAPAVPPVVATPIAQQPVAAPAPAPGRSTRDIVILAFLLSDALLFLMWGARPGARARAGDKRVGIYDLPDPQTPAVDAT